MKHQYRFNYNSKLTLSKLFIHNSLFAQKFYNNNYLTCMLLVSKQNTKHVSYFFFVKIHKIILHLNFLQIVPHTYYLLFSIKKEYRGTWSYKHIPVIFRTVAHFIQTLSCSNIYIFVILFIIIKIYETKQHLWKEYKITSCIKFIMYQKKIHEGEMQRHMI